MREAGKGGSLRKLRWVAWLGLRRQYGGVIYLDHNATTPIAPEVREAMLPYLAEKWGNPSSSYRFGSKLKGVVETAREQVAGLLGARAGEILFTSCATESNHAAIHAALTQNDEVRTLCGCGVDPRRAGPPAAPVTTLTLVDHQAKPQRGARR